HTPDCVNMPTPDTQRPERTIQSDLHHDRKGACGMKKMMVLTAALAVVLAGCGSSSKKSAAGPDVQRQADLYAIDQIEQTWHKASSTHDVDLMMTLWAPDATFNNGTETLSGKAEIRAFFTHKAGPFQPQNHWVSETPAYKIRTTV